MPGEWIKKRQVELYMKARHQGYSQVSSAAKAGISERSGRSIDQGTRADPILNKRHWRTRRDPLAQVWDSELVPLLHKTPTLQPITLLEYLQAKYPHDYPDSLGRTLQRRVKKWLALYGPHKEVMFYQTHKPGRQGLSDFTKLKKVCVTIAGQLFDHLLYHFRLAYSHWSFIKIIQGGESYTALAEGLQEALRKLGGVPHEHRTDSLSAAFKNLQRISQEDMTVRYDAFCRHYGMRATRNNRGLGHENGSIESPHGHMKRRIEQAILLRGSSDFNSIQDYQLFIEKVVDQANRRHAKAIDLERPYLLALPQTRATDYSEVRAVVSSSSTISIKSVTYTVPSRLQGEVLYVRVYDDRLVCYLGYTHVISLKRAFVPPGKRCGRQVDYRHVIHSLIRKPQAFRYSQLREDLLPNDTYRTIWKEVDAQMEAKKACQFIVGILQIAALHDCEQPLGQAVLNALKQKKPLSVEHFQKQFCKQTHLISMDITIHHAPLEYYNQLIPEPFLLKGECHG